MTTDPTMPTQGGSYLRDEETGALIRLPDADPTLEAAPAADVVVAVQAPAPTPRKGGQ